MVKINWDSVDLYEQYSQAKEDFDHWSEVADELLMQVIVDDDDDDVVVRWISVLAMIGLVTANLVSLKRKISES